MIIEKIVANRRLHLHFFSKKDWTGKIIIPNIAASNNGMMRGLSIYNANITAISAMILNAKFDGVVFMVIA